MWFAALLGLGSLVLPVGLIEKLAEASGLSAFVPAAAPPLGFKARAGIAFAGMVLGGILGFFAARKLAPAAPDQPRRRPLVNSDAPRRLPINPQEELGSDSFDSVADFATSRRRVLAAREELRKSDFFQIAPLPGQSHNYAARDDQTLDLAESAEFTEVQDLEVHDTPVAEEETMSQVQVLSLVPGEPESGDPLNFSPPSLARPAAPEISAQAAQVVALEVTASADAEVEAQSETEIETEAEAEAEAQTDQPDLVALVQRLAATLERHREWAAQRSEPAPAAAPVPSSVVVADFGAECAAPAEAAQAMAAFFAPVGEDAEPHSDEDLHELTASFALPLNDKPAQAAQPAEEPADEQPGSDGYSPLLAVKNPFRDQRPAFVRVDEPETHSDEPQPAVIFPHEGPTIGVVRPFDRPGSSTAAPAPSGERLPVSPVLTGEDNERVLREALLNLQRIGR
jgi:hypothetical protein